MTAMLDDKSQSENPCLQTKDDLGQSINKQIVKAYNDNNQIDRYRLCTVSVPSLLLLSFWRLFYLVIACTFSIYPTLNQHLRFQQIRLKLYYQRGLYRPVQLILQA